MNSKAKYVIGIDVGTGSARAGVFDARGQQVSYSKQNITSFHQSGQVVEQSAHEIWNAVCNCVRSSVAQAGLDPSQIAGISFDATCSLVVVGPKGIPLPVSAAGEAERNIIVWMDHRATSEADFINATAHPVLDYVGGRISPEMQMPKLLWLKKNNPDTFRQAWQFFDLTDYLTWRSTGDLARSCCTVTCKWNYLAHQKRWDDDYFHAIGLSTFPQQAFRRIGQQIVDPGTPCGSGLLFEAAQAMGLAEGTPVAAGLIDAHAGGVGSLGVGDTPEDKLAYVFGTSSCTMTSTGSAAFVPGVWGPYYSAMVPGYWLSEGGQSAAGAAIERLIEMHPAAEQAKAQAESAGQSLPVYLANLALKISSHASETVRLAEKLHIVPEFLGNRAPTADPYARAVICGLGMERDLDSLVALYVAGICSLGYGLRQIIDAQSQKEVKTTSVIISGGAGRHPLVRQLLADTCDRPIVATQAEEPVLLGSAVLAAVAGGLYASVPEAMKQMTTREKEYLPARDYNQLHTERYNAFRLLQLTAKKIRKGEIETTDI